MADKIKAGCVVVTEFCRQGDDKFTGYINYIDRNEAVRNEATAQYNLYQEYMGNPLKTTGLFTENKDRLTMDEKKALKSVFETAQKNGSLMWQTVISFDNRWLEANGLYNSDTKISDEARLVTTARSAIGKMLHNEGLDNAVWSGAIHYNTDNIHIHIATVEPTPMREQKLYNQYDEVIKDGKKYKFPILDEKGEPVKEMEYKGRFKKSSIEICKREMVNQILNEKENNLKINKIIRDSIVKQKQSFAKDEKLKSAFDELYRQMPQCNKNMWNYNNPIMAKVRPQIDKLSDMYISEYHQEDFELLKDSLDNQEIVYKEAYGNSGRSYSEGKKRDLHERLGNAILKEIRTYNKELKNLENKHFNMDEIIEVRYDPSLENEEKNLEVRYDPQGEIHNIFEESSAEKLENFIESEIDFALQPELEPEDVYCEWSKTFKYAKELIYCEEPDYGTAKELLRDEHYAGNVLATSELANIYQYGRGCEISKEIADEYYKVALKNWIYLYENPDPEKGDTQQGRSNYYAYRIGKQYYYGQGTEQDYNNAGKWLKLSENKYAKYMLGKMAYYGQGEDKNFKKAFSYFIQLSDDKKNKGKDFNAYACYKAASMLENGEIVYERVNYEELYKRAFKHFMKMLNKNQDDNLQYRVGMMYRQGKGVKTDEEKGERYLEKSAKAGNVYAKYQLAQIYLERENKEEVLKAVEFLTEAATKGENIMAMYSLGEVYLSDREYLQDIGKAFYWYHEAEKAGNEFASYKLGKLYMKEENTEKAIEHLSKCNNKAAYYQLGKIHMDKELDDNKFYDVYKSIEYFTKAYEEGFDYAAYQLGNIYASDIHGIKNLNKAIYWYDTAEKQGVEFASYRLGKIFMEQASNKEAIEKFEKCGDNSFALYFKGKIYLDKESGVFNFNKGIEAMMVSAQMDNSFAQMYIGIMYIKGDLINRDIDMAKRWMERAAENGNEFAEEIKNNLDNNIYAFKRGNAKRFAIGKSFILGMAVRSLRDATRKQMEERVLAREYEQMQERSLQKNNSEID